MPATHGTQQSGTIRASSAVCPEFKPQTPIFIFYIDFLWNHKCFPVTAKKTYGNGDGRSLPLPHPCHANGPDVMGTKNSCGCVWKAAPSAETQSLCESSEGLGTFDKVLKTSLLTKHICGTDKPGKCLFGKCVSNSVVMAIYCCQWRFDLQWPHRRRTNLHTSFLSFCNFCPTIYIYK